jgi:hypothetical protein
VYGTYPAVDNDATIMENVLEANKELRNLIQPNDHILMDRGFRDVKDTLETKYKLKTHMPSIKPLKNNQLSTIEANHSRFVTKCRWTVEAVNGLLKILFKANDKVVDNKTLQHSIDDYRIGASLINKYHSRLFSDKDNPTLITTNMKEKLYTPNKLESVIDTIHRKSRCFTEVGIESLKDFPKLDINSIKYNITDGSYQLKSSSSYIDEIKTVALFKGDPKLLDPSLTLLRTHIKSRHKNRKSYTCYVSYKPNMSSHRAIDSYICTCPIGKRTVGTCSHVASLIYKLSTLNDTKEKSRKTLDSIFPSLPVYDSSSETETDDEYSEFHSFSAYTESTLQESATVTKSSNLYPELFDPDKPGTSGISTKNKTTTIEIANPEYG